MNAHPVAAAGAGATFVSVPLRGKDSHERLEYPGYLQTFSSWVSVPLRGKDSHERGAASWIVSGELFRFRPLAGKR